MYKVYLKRYLVLVYRKKSISIVSQIFKHFIWSVIYIVWVESLNCDKCVTQGRKLKQHLNFRPLSVNIFEMFNFHQLASFFSFFFWSVNCKSLVCKLYILFRTSPKILKVFIFEVVQWYMYRRLLSTHNSFWKCPFFLVCKLWKLGNIYMGNIFRTLQFLYFKSLVMT